MDTGSILVKIHIIPHFRSNFGEGGCSIFLSDDFHSYSSYVLPKMAAILVSVYFKL